jgi:hypothetical protein
MSRRCLCSEAQFKFSVCRISNTGTKHLTDLISKAINLGNKTHPLGLGALSFLPISPVVFLLFYAITSWLFTLSIRVQNSCQNRYFPSVKARFDCSDRCASCIGWIILWSTTPSELLMLLILYHLTTSTPEVYTYTILAYYILWHEGWFLSEILLVSPPMTKLYLISFLASRIILGFFCMAKDCDSGRLINLLVTCCVCM